MKIFTFTLICSLLSLSNTIGQEITLKLIPEVKSSHERNYIFEEVIDSRLEKSIGFIHDSDRNKQKASFDGQLAQQALTFYNSKITSPLPHSYKLQIKIHNLDLKEIYRTNVRGYKGEIQLSLGFFLIGGEEPVHLVDFNSRAEYGRPANQADNVQISIQRLFENSWEYFDAWINTQYQSNRSLASKVRLKIVDPIRQSNNDTVYYDPARPLSWDDFTGAVTPGSAYNATIFSSLSIEGNASVENGEIVQTVSVKVYMIPDQSWVKNANSYANNHEQKHFDLTRIAANRMIDRLKNAELEPALFEAKLNDIYLDSYREMSRLQDLYDNQTQNGINKDMQQFWNQLISNALKGDWEKLDSILSQEK